MTIPPRFLDELRDRLTLSEVVAKRVRLLRAGREFKGCCPFHAEKSPSFYVNDDKQFYHCFGCGAHGDVIGFTMQHDNLSFIDALEALAPLAGMDVPQATPQAVEQAKKEKSLHALLDDAAKFFIAQLQDARNADVRAYVTERRIAEAEVAGFRLGYAPAEGRALIGVLAAKDYTPAQMIEAGLARRSEKNGEVYGFFRDRLMFPVTDRRGRVVAFSGRQLPEHIRPQPEGAPKSGKYINSPDTPLFHKGRLLYNEAQARQAAAEGQDVIVVEGQIDVIACAAAKFRGTVAPLGTALTEEQIASLWKMLPGEEKVPVLCFDGDAAGSRAASRACLRFLPLLKPYHSARFAFLPQGQDPDSLIRQGGAEAFTAVLNSALPLIDMLWRNRAEGRALGTPEARAGLAAALEGDIALIPDRTVQHYYRQAVRDKLYRAFGPQKTAPQRKAAPRRTVNGVKDRYVPPPPPDHTLPRPSAASTGRAEAILLATLLNHPHIFDQVEDGFCHLVLADARLEKLKRAALSALTDDHALDRDGLHTHLKAGGHADALDALLSAELYLHAGFARPDAPSDQILSGWQDMARRLNEVAHAAERVQAALALKGDFTLENERRVLELAEKPE